MMALIHQKLMDDMYSQGKQFIRDTRTEICCVRPIHPYAPSYSVAPSGWRGTSHAFKYYEGKGMSHRTLFHQSLISLYWLKVLKRQGHMCAITRLADESHPKSSSGSLDTATLECVHILKRAVAVLPSATSTLDADRDKVSIQYTRLVSSTYLT